MYLFGLPFISNFRSLQQAGNDQILVDSCIEKQISLNLWIQASLMNSAVVNHAHWGSEG